MPSVLIQAGHSDRFPPYRSGGGGAPGEAGWTADLATRFAQRLRAAGVEVVLVGSWLSGQTVYTPPPEMKRDYSLAAFLHYDSDTYTERTGGFADRYEYDTPTTAARSAAALAAWERIYPVATGIPLRNNRRNVATSRYYGYRAKTANTPALLIEHGVGQGWDKTILFDRIDIVADADASAILAYLGVPEVTPQEQSILEAASRRSIDDGAELDFLMGTRDTLAEQKASLETLLATSQSETRQWMAEAERWKQLAQNTTTPTAATVSHVGLEVVFDNGQSQTLRAVP